MNPLSLPGAPDWFITLLNLSLQAVLLAALVWIIIKSIGRWIPPVCRALLWFIVLARVVIPYAPPSQFSLQNLFSTPPAQPAPKQLPSITTNPAQAPFQFATSQTTPSNALFDSVSQTIPTIASATE